MLLPRTARRGLHYIVLVITVIVCVRLYDAYRLPQQLDAIITTNPTGQPAIDLAGLTADPVLSQLFGLPEYHSKIYRDYHASSRLNLADDVTSCLVVTSNRLDVLKIWAETYDGVFMGISSTDGPGPLSVVYSMSPDESLLQLQQTLSESKLLRNAANIHLAVSDFPRQLNAWRNLARRLADTEFVLMVDADLVLRGEGLDRIHLHSSVLALRRLERQTRMDGELDAQLGMVIPAFEWSDERGWNSSAWVKDRDVRLCEV